jgi:twitching motility protein PilI
MFDDNLDIDDSLNQATSDLASSFQNLQNPEGDLHLRFYVESGLEFALPAQGIREVLSTHISQVTPIPNVSPFLMGVLNLRGQVIWIADIGQFLGETKALSVDRGELAVIAIEANDLTVGLAVASVRGMDWLRTDDLHPIHSIDHTIAPFLKGEWSLNSADPTQNLRLLDPSAIIRSARWAA